MFLLILAVLTVLILLDFLSLIKERCNWIKYVGVRISKFDVDDGVIISVSQSPNHYTTQCTQFFTPLTDIPL